ncbi:MAG: PqqD family protein [Planctomycetota bacterium]
MTRYRVSREVLLREEEDGGIALDSRTGRMLGLNLTAYQILHWLIHEPATLEELVIKLAEKYHDAEPRQAIKKHIEHFLAYLNRIKLLETSLQRLDE